MAQEAQDHRETAAVESMPLLPVSSLVEPWEQVERALVGDAPGAGEEEQERPPSPQDLEGGDW